MVILPYFPAVGLRCLQLLRYYESNGFQFQMTAVRHPGFLKLEILTAGPVWRANMCHQAKFSADRSNRCGDMAVFYFVQDGGVRHLKFLDLFYVYLDHPRRSFVGLCHYAKFGWNRCSGFDNMPVLMFCEFGLKMPIHAPFWVVCGGFDPLDETQYQPIVQ